MDTPGGIAAQLAEDLSPQDVREVLDVFRGDIVRLCDRLAAAAQSADPAMMRRIAHSIAGAAGAVGASSLEYAARRVMAPGAPNDQDLSAQCRDIARLVERTLHELDAVVARLDA